MLCYFHHEILASVLLDFCKHKCTANYTLWGQHLAQPRPVASHLSEVKHKNTRYAQPALDLSVSGFVLTLFAWLLRQGESRPLVLRMCPSGEHPAFTHGCHLSGQLSVHGLSSFFIFHCSTRFPAQVRWIPAPLKGTGDHTAVLAACESPTEPWGAPGPAGWMGNLLRAGELPSLGMCSDGRCLA